MGRAALVMGERDEEPAGGRAVVLIDDPTTCVVQQTAALVSIQRGPLTGASLSEFCDALEEAARERPRLVLLAVFRLDRRFPIPADFETRLPLLARALRIVDRRLAAIASVAEFGGVRAAVMEATSRVVWALGQPAGEIASFRGITDAAQWLVPHGGGVGVTGGLETYVRLYRLAASRLQRHD